MAKKRKSAPDAKGERLWIQETLERLRALQDARGPDRAVTPPEAVPKPARSAPRRKKK